MRFGEKSQSCYKRRETERIIEAIHQIVSYLKASNHSQIGFLWGEQVEARNFALRREGFEQAMRYYNLPFSSTCNVLTVDSTFTEPYQGVLGLVRRGLKLPTGLVCANNLIASACLKALNKQQRAHATDGLS